MADGGATAFLVVSLLATGVQVAQQRTAASQAKADAKANADQERLRLRGDLIERKKRFVDQQKANIAASAASGIDPFSGSNAKETEEGFRRFNLETLSAKVSSEGTQRNIKSQGSQLSRANNIGAANSLLQGVGGVAQSGVFTKTPTK